MLGGYILGQTRFEELMIWGQTFLEEVRYRDTLQAVRYGKILVKKYDLGKSF